MNIVLKGCVKYVIDLVYKLVLRFSCKYKVVIDLFFPIGEV